MNTQVKAIRNASILLPDGTFETGDIRIDDGTIAAVGEKQSERPAIDAAGAYVLPGLIDLHVHGIGMMSFKGGSDLKEISRLEASRGTTTFFPTIFASPESAMALLRQFLSETDELRGVSQVGGFRLESPYLAVPSGGMPEDCVPIDRQTTDALLEAGRGHIKIWDLSPELQGAPDEIVYLSRRGVVCSIAHTLASIEQGRAAVDAGASLVTHMFDVLTPPEFIDPDHDIAPLGIMDYLLIEDRVTCEIIGDGTHVHPILVEKAIRCKTPSRVAFVTDSNLGAGLSPGLYSLPGSWGNALIQGPNNGIRLPDRGMCLAGSALTPLDSFINAVRLFGKDLSTAVRLCSTTPARLTGLNKGEVAVGKDADLIILDKNLELIHTISAGKIVYDASKDVTS